MNKKASALINIIIVGVTSCTQGNNELSRYFTYTFLTNTCNFLSNHSCLQALLYILKEMELGTAIKCMKPIKRPSNS